MSIKGALSVHFSYQPNDSVTVSLLTDIQGIAAYLSEETEYAELSINLESDTRAGGRFLIVSTLLGETTIDSQDYCMNTDSNVPEFDIWIFIYDTVVSVYCNDTWIYSYSLAYSTFSAYHVTASLKVIGGTLTLSNIRREEIPDRKEATYIDYETTGDNALQSVYQQRPLWIFSEVGRSISFTYRATKDDVDAHHIYKYQRKDAPVSDASSDGIVYFYDVGMSINEQTAREIGFVTKLYRLSDLDEGGTEAVSILQERAIERKNPIYLECRFDPRIEISDVLLIDVILTGTERHIQKRVIVETISIPVFQDGDFYMEINGREDK